LLTSVPYRNQLNFTFDGLRSAASNVEKLRNFAARLKEAKLDSGSGAGQELAREATGRMKAGMDDDLNTAQAHAAILEMVRKANAALDAGEVKRGDVAPLQSALDSFDQIFAVMTDDDAEKMKKVYDWAIAEGREKEVSNELRDFVSSSA